MAITFQCEHCRKEVKAPESAAGKRGKCPFCGQSCYIPAPVAESDVLSLAPLDETDERTSQEEDKRLREAQRELLAQTKAQEPQPTLDQKEAVEPEDLHHLVVNYCLDLAEGNLERADATAADLRKRRPASSKAVDDFINNRVPEDALKKIPPKLLRGFLLDLRGKLR